MSDGLADGRVVSGVGGQYNFVAMAHSLPDARSILTLRSTREKNFQADLEHPVELRTHDHSAPFARYRGHGIRRRGFARLERSGCDCRLVEHRGFALSGRPETRSAGGRKTAADYQIPDMHRNNTPRALEERFVLARARGLFSEFPFGTDLTREEIVLAKALTRIKDKTSRGWPRFFSHRTRGSVAKHAGERQALPGAHVLGETADARRNGCGSACWCASCAPWFSEPAVRSIFARCAAQSSSAPARRSATGSNVGCADARSRPCPPTPPAGDNRIPRT